MYTKAVNTMCTRVQFQDYNVPPYDGVLCHSLRFDTLDAYTFLAARHSNFCGQHHHHTTAVLNFMVQRKINSSRHTHSE